MPAKAVLPRPAAAKPQRQHKSRRSVPLALALPASVALLGALFWARRKRRAKAQRVRAQQQAQVPAGAVVDLQLPKAPPKAPFLPMIPPKQLKTVMLDVRLPGVPVVELWRAVFANPAQFLTAFHSARGDFDLELSPWRQADGTLAQRTLAYTSPLSNPLGPRQARNTEVMEAAQLGAAGFVLTTRCTTEGVPFSSNFANYLQWVGVEDSSGSSRLIVTGECRFHNPVWGPLRGKIESESIKGMAKAYAQFAQMLQEQLGGSGGAGGGPTYRISAAAGPTQATPGSTLPFGLSTPRTQLASLLGGNGQEGTAVMLLLLVLCVLVYRMSLGDVVALQYFRRLTGQYFTGAPTTA